jgi:hypothetical protein
MLAIAAIANPDMSWTAERIKITIVLNVKGRAFPGT